MLLLAMDFYFYSLSVKARPSDPLDYVWILWCFCILYTIN